MGLKEAWTALFEKQSREQVRGKLPFIHMFGSENSFGKIVSDTAKHDFAKMVEYYRSWVYACAWKNAISVAKCRLRLYREQRFQDKDEELVQIFDHPFLDVLKSANPFMNKFELLTQTQIFMELTGNAYWWVPRNVIGVPEQIWCLPSHWIQIVPSKTEFIKGYLMTVPGKGTKVPFPEEEIIHFRFPSPFDIHYGTSPLLGSSLAVDLNENIKRWAISYFNNNAQPGGVLMTDQPVTPEEHQRLIDGWNKKHRGREKAGKIAILSNGLKFEKIGSNIQDAKFDDMSKEIRDEILAIFGVPASKLGLVEDVNRANAEANDFTYQKETVLPRLNLIEEKLNEKFLVNYDVDLIAKFDNPVPADKEHQLKERQINIQTGYSSIDDQRIGDGEEPYDLPETQAPLIPFSSVPAGSPKPDIPFGDPQAMSMKKKNYKDNKWKSFATVTAPQEKLFESTIRRFFNIQHSEIMRRINNYKGMNTKGLYEDIIFDFNSENDRLKGFTRNNVRQAYVSGLELGMQDTDSSIDLNLFEPNIIRAVEQRLDFFSSSVNTSTLKSLKSEIEIGLTQGESIEDISKRVDSIFNFSEDFRAKRIAQTEVIGAVNDGQIRAYSEAGIESKEWLTARDEKVRDSHQIDGQTVSITEDFTSGLGNKLKYPGDRTSGAPAEDVINCRCTVVPVIRRKE